MPILDRKHLLEMMSQLMESRRILIEHQPPPISCPDLDRVPLPRSVPISKRDWVRPGDEMVNGIGDTTCAHNAKSPYIRCAIKPCGPCEGCGDYSCD